MNPETLVRPVLTLVPRAAKQRCAAAFVVEKRKSRCSPEKWIDGGDMVVVIGTFNARAKGGRDGSWRFAHVWQMRSGKGARVEPFIDTLAELSALGGVP